jgi:hypothetical protein
MHGSLTAWGGGQTASLCSMGGLTDWVGGRTTNLCFECDLTASYDQ